MGSTSVEMSFGYIMAKQHNNPMLAYRILAERCLHKDPSNMHQFLQRHLELSPEWIFKAEMVYRDILAAELAYPNSKFRRAVDTVISTMGNKPFRFIVCTGNNEMVWACGLRESEARRATYFHGQNLYGSILDDLVDAYRRNAVPTEWGLDALVHTPIYWPLTLQKTVLIISDSQCRQMKAVRGGKVLSIRSGRYNDALPFLDDPQFNMRQFAIIIVACGTNSAQLLGRNARGGLDSEVDPWPTQRATWAPLRRRLSALKPTGGEGYPKILISNPVPNPGALGLSGHSFNIQKDIKDSGLMCINWFDRATNPFCFPDGSIAPSMFYEDDPFHLSHHGIRELWKEWIKYLPELRNISFDIRWDFFSVKPNRKRRRA